jgi:hypothetical protein
VHTDIFGPLDTQLYTTKWNKIHRISHTEESRPSVIIYANNLLHHTLKRLGYLSKTMSDRFTSHKYIFKNKYAARIKSIDLILKRSVNINDLDLSWLLHNQENNPKEIKYILGNIRI